MAAGKYIDILKDRGFFSFFWTQFLGAFNDNFYKIIVTLVALDIPAGRWNPIYSLDRGAFHSSLPALFRLRGIPRRHL